MSLSVVGGRARVALLLAVTLVAGACGVLSGTRPAPTPADFLGISGALVSRGLTVTRVVSGDAGCDDRTMARTAISFRASGLDQPTAVPVHLYIFGSRDSYQKLRNSVDACARSYVSDPETLVSIDAEPFVVIGQGPWGPQFTAAVRSALTETAGSG